jgi:hypothetical protein
MKEDRIKDIVDAIDAIKDLQKYYMGGSPAWILLQNAWGHLKSIHHLETVDAFNPSTLGVKGESE